MKKVLHYKTKFLNKSETFISRLVHNHNEYNAMAMCYKPMQFTGELTLYSVPDRGLGSLINTLCFHLNWPLPYFLKTIREVKPDLIHAHFGYDAQKMIGPARSTGVPLITSFYGSDVTRLPTKFDWKRRYTKLAHFGSHFIAASEIMKQQLVEIGFPKQKISIVPFGLDLKVFEFRENYSLSNNCMMVGRMVEKKGFEYAIRAIEMLNSEKIEIHLNLYGDGPLKEYLQKLTQQLKINHLVTFHGFVDIKHINCAMNSHGILLAPSVIGKDGDQEGLPNTILEAMACGLPVIATRHAAIPEAVTHTESGFLVDERQPRQIAEILKRILNSEFDLERIRFRAHNYIKEKHTVSRMVKSIENIYDSVLTE